MHARERKRKSASARMAIIRNLFNLSCGKRTTGKWLGPRAEGFLRACGRLLWIKIVLFGVCLFGLMNITYLHCL